MDATMSDILTPQALSKEGQEAAAKNKSPESKPDPDASETTPLLTPHASNQEPESSATISGPVEYIGYGISNGFTSEALNMEAKSSANLPAPDAPETSSGTTAEDLYKTVESSETMCDPGDYGASTDLTREDLNEEPQSSATMPDPDGAYLGYWISTEFTPEDSNKEAKSSATMPDPGAPGTSTSKASNNRVQPSANRNGPSPANRANERSSRPDWGWASLSNEL
jgi:hypothetical protein